MGVVWYGAHEVVVDAIVVVGLVLVEPDFGQAHRVLLKRVGPAGRPRVRRALAEDVADVRTRRRPHRAAAHPHLHAFTRTTCTLSHSH